MKQFLRFGMIGLFNSIINYIIYALCIRTGMHYVLANIISFIITIFVAYLLQGKFVFKKNEEDKQQTWWKVLIKTYMSYAFTGLILTNILFILWLDIIKISTLLEPFYQLSKDFFMWKDEYTFAKYFVPFLNTFIILPINFVLNKYWTYRKSR